MNEQLRRQSDRLRTLLALLVVAAPAIVLAAVIPFQLSNLPAVLATHWGGDGADGFSSARPFTAGIVIAVGVLLAGAVVVAASKASKPAKAFGLGLFGFGTWMATAIWGSSVIATVSAETPEQAPLWPSMLLVIPGAFLGWFAAWLAPREAAHDCAVQAAAVPVSADGPVEWSGTAKSTSMLVIVGLLGLVIIGLQIVLIFVGDLLISVVPMVIALAAIVVTVGSSSADVTVDERGLRVRSRLFGFPMRRIAIDEIASVAAQAIAPMDWGGWGWRWMPGGSAVVYRRGPAIVVITRNDRKFAVTVDGAADGAAVLQRLLDGSVQPQ